MKTYYDKKYFSWQQKAGLYAANQDTWMYAPFLKKTDTVLDFGCGGGYLLANLPGKHKYGVDVNEQALKEAARNGITTFTSLASLPARLKFDAIISNHTLEHVDNPGQILNELRTHLKPKGRLIIVVPIDDWRKQKTYTPDDINNHLYTWTPLLIGNLVHSCGYTVKSITLMTYHWLPLSRFYYRYVPAWLYYPLCHLWGALSRVRAIRVVATVR